MMQDLKGSIDRDSEHYKALKDGLLKTSKDFLNDYKKQFCKGEDSESDTSSDERLVILSLSIISKWHLYL